MKTDLAKQILSEKTGIKFLEGWGLSEQVLSAMYEFSSAREPNLGYIIVTNCKGTKFPLNIRSILKLEEYDIDNDYCPNMHTKIFHLDNDYNLVQETCEEITVAIRNERD
jgi:hypothetical protein